VSRVSLSHENAAAALRSDLARHPGLADFGEATSLWTGYVSVLIRAVRASLPLPPLLRDFVKLLVQEPGARALLRAQPDYRLVREANRALRAQDLGAFSSSTRALAARMEDAGALALGDTALQMLLFVRVDGNGIALEEQGRVIAHRARITRQVGDTDLSGEQYRNVERIARAARSDELYARAWIGFAVLAMFRGNFPECAEWFARAATAADKAGDRDLSRNAHHGSLIAAAKRDAFDDALRHGWLAFRYSIGDVQLEAEALSNLGGVMLQARIYRPALAAFDAAIRRNPPARLVIPALGGAMLTSARLGHATRARERYATLARYAAASDLRWEIADSLIDAAIALLLIGDAAESDRARLRALELAREGKFHELEFRAERVANESPQQALIAVEMSRETRTICEQVEQLDANELLELSALSEAP
jgi:tetratricopeptide (TPR) repeat protein